MPLPRNIYLLDPKKLNPETIAVAFAKTSRSPLSFQQIADELSDKKSADFHEKWVVGYGHSSVAEHAVLHIAVENISRLAVECLESNRLASYTEKSSRYQIWDREHFYIPTELRNSHLRRDYIQLMELLFDHYQESVKVVEEYLQRIAARTTAHFNIGCGHRLRMPAVIIFQQARWRMWVFLSMLAHLNTQSKKCCLTHLQKFAKSGKKSKPWRRRTSPP